MGKKIEKSVKYLNRLQETVGETWKQELDCYLKEEEDGLDDESKDYIFDFIMTYKEEVMENKTSNLQEVEKKINNDLLLNNLKDYMKNMLEPYYTFAPLRAFYVKAPNETPGLLEEIFGRSILRYNFDILQEYEKFGFDNMKAFGSFLSILDSMCIYIVKRNMYCAEIEDFIYDQTRLPRTLCKKITDLIEANFDSMKLNYIIEKLNQMEEE